MQLTYDDEQEAFREGLRRFLEAVSPAVEVRRAIEAGRGPDRAVWRRMADELGVPGLHLPESLGGQGFGAVEQGIVMQELGRAVASSPYLGSIALAAEALVQSGDEAAQRAWLPGWLSGARVGALAIAEPGGGWRAADVAAIATPHAGLHPGSHACPRRRRG